MHTVLQVLAKLRIASTVGSVEAQKLLMPGPTKGFAICLPTPVLDGLVVSFQCIKRQVKLQRIRRKADPRLAASMISIPLMTRKRNNSWTYRHMNLKEGFLCQVAKDEVSQIPCLAMRSSGDNCQNRMAIHISDISVCQIYQPDIEVGIWVESIHNNRLSASGSEVSVGMGLVV